MHRRLQADITIALFVNALIVGVSIVFGGATGPIIVAYVASLLLILRTLCLVRGGLNYIRVASRGTSRLGRVVLIHSHHDPWSRSRGHEFQVGEKYFCAGCCGLVAGTAGSLSVATAYLVGVIQTETLGGLLALAPVCFAPTILRCTTFTSVGASARFFSYGLLPLGSWVVILGLDSMFHSWLVNVALLSTVVLGWNVGGWYLSAHDQ